MKLIILFILLLPSCTTQVKTIRYPSGKEVRIVDKQSVEIKKFWISMFGEVLKSVAKTMVEKNY